MKNLKLLYILALGFLLTLGACEKNSKSSSNDPSTPEGKIEMAIAALNTDGEKLMNKLEQKGWGVYDNSSEGPIYNKGDEYCMIVFYGEDDLVMVVQWMDGFSALSDAKKDLKGYHSATTEKYNKNYGGVCGKNTFNEPSDFIDFVNSASESELLRSIPEVYEIGRDSKKGIDFHNRLLIQNSLWAVYATVMSEDY